METLELTQEEIRILLFLLDSYDLENTRFYMGDLMQLHSKISSLQTY